MQKIKQITNEDFLFFDSAIRNDIPGAIAARANFLTALGLVSYTEFIGAIMNGQLGLEGKSEENFNTGFYAMGEGYKVFDGQVRERFGKSFYKIFRCGLVHEYFAKEPFLIAKNNKGDLGVGWANDRIAMANTNYFRHILIVLDDIKATLAIIEGSTPAR